MIRTRLATALLVLVLPACGGGGGTSNPSNPSNPQPVLSSPVPATTITISAAGVSPNNVTVAAGTRVTFVNQSSRSHEIASNPHPTHTICPPINQLGDLQPGASAQTGPLTAGTCGYHDHNDPDNVSLRGQIIIQ